MQNSKRLRGNSTSIELKGIPPGGPPVRKSVTEPGASVKDKPLPLPRGSLVGTPIELVLVQALFDSEEEGVRVGTSDKTGSRAVFVLQARFPDGAVDEDK